MGLTRTAYRTVNALLGKAGLTLQGISRDFDARLENPRLVERMTDSIAAEAERWLTSQSLFEARPFDTAAAVASFYQDYLSSPYRQPFGGSRFNNLAWLFLISRAYAPSVIVDSGTYQGASAWALHQGSPHVPLYSFDIDMSQIRQKVDATYVEADWTTHRFAEDVSRGLCYFDDHVDQARRLLETQAAGFPLAIFDDDFTVSSFAEMAHGGAALPKVEFVLDEELRKEKELVWSEKGARHSWPVDVPYLDKARAAIAQAERLPNTSLVTGIHQTPYQVVKIALER